ncbi:MAG: DnaJ domain-containing protein [Chloroflexota bacterium]
MPALPDHYSLLGIPRNATQAEIKKAYFEAAQRSHPDKHSGPGQTERFLQIQQAYEVLSDKNKRARYDTTLPPEPEPPVKTDILYSRHSLVHLADAQMIYVLLEFAPDKVDHQSKNAPLNVCLVIDRSTSMQGEKMDMVKATAVRLLRELEPKDLFGLVTFSDRADVVLPIQYGHENLKSESRVQMIQPSGSTEILQGLRTGLAEVRQTFDPSRINHIVMLTDGHTYGDEQACLDLAREAAEQGIGISSLGIGSDWNDSFLDALANQTGGNSIYVSKPADIQTLLSQKFQHLSRTFAEDVSLDISTNKDVSLTYAFRLQPDVGSLPLENSIRLGAILRDTPLKVLLEFTVKPLGKKVEHIKLLDGRVKMTIPQATPPIHSTPLTLSRSLTAGSDAEPPPQPIIQAMSRLSLYRMQEKARKAASEGQYEKASRHLTYLATHLLAQGERGLAKTVLLEADQIQRSHTLSETGQKTIKYGTRALLLPGRNEGQNP